MGENNFRVGDVVVIAKEPCDMGIYGKAQEAKKSLKIGSIGAVQAISKTDCLVNFEQINGAMRSWYVHPSCLKKISTKEAQGKKAVICNIKNEKDATSANFERMNSACGTTFKTGDVVEIVEIRDHTWNIGCSCPINVAGIRVPDGYKRGGTYYVAIEYIDLCLGDEKVEVKVKADCSAPQEEEIPTPIEALKKATTYNIGQSIQFIPDDSTEVYMGIIEAYVVTRKQIFLQTTNGDLVLPNKVLKQKR